MSVRLLLAGVLLLGGGAAGVASVLVRGDAGLSGLLGVLALLGEGAALVDLGTVVDGFPRSALIVAGAARLVEVVLALLPAAGALGPAPFLFAALVGAAATVAGAVALVARQDLPWPLRWGLAVPAAAILLTIVAQVARLDLPWLAVLPEAGFAAAGVALVVTAGTRRVRR